MQRPLTYIPTPPRVCVQVNNISLKWNLSAETADAKLRFVLTSRMWSRPQKKSSEIRKQGKNQGICYSRCLTTAPNSGGAADSPLLPKRLNSLSEKGIQVQITCSLSLYLHTYIYIYIKLDVTVLRDCRPNFLMWKLCNKSCHWMRNYASSGLRHCQRKVR